VTTKIGCFPTQALAFSPVSIQTQRTQRTQRMQRKRLRLDGNRALLAHDADNRILDISTDGAVYQSFNPCRNVKSVKPVIQH